MMNGFREGKSETADCFGARECEVNDETIKVDR